jgi:hypothetical protein
MTDEQAARLIDLLESILPMKKKIDEISEVLPIIETLGEAVMFRKMEADEMFGLNKQTLSKSSRAETFDEVGKRATYVNLKSLTVYRAKQRKKRNR